MLPYTSVGSDSTTPRNEDKKMSNNSSLLRKYKEEPAKVAPAQKDKLIVEYAPLIKFIAQKIAVRLPSNIELDDLISSGVIGSDGRDR